MNNIKSEFINAIMMSLKIDRNPFITSTIDEYTKDINPSDYKSFMTALFGTQHQYLNGLDRVAKVADSFKQDMTDNLLSNTKSQAKAMYDKFYNESCKMLDYCTQNRDKVSNDREFFLNTKYEDLKKSDGSKAYSKQEIYVLNYLGGGSWLLGIRFYDNSSKVIDKIENIIKEAVLTKYDAGKMLSGVTNKLEIKRG